MLGVGKAPLRNSPLCSEFTPHLRRGPEGPFDDLAAASEAFGQGKKGTPAGRLVFLFCFPEIFAYSAQMDALPGRKTASARRVRFV